MNYWGYIECTTSPVHTGVLTFLFAQKSSNTFIKEYLFKLINKL